MEHPKELCEEWGRDFFLYKKHGIDFTIGSDLIDLINLHKSVLNRHLVSKTIKTAMLKEELRCKRQTQMNTDTSYFKTFLSGWLKGVNNE